MNRARSVSDPNRHRGRPEVRLRSWVSGGTALMPKSFYATKHPRAMLRLTAVLICFCEISLHRAICRMRSAFERFRPGFWLTASRLKFWNLLDGSHVTHGPGVRFRFRRHSCSVNFTVAHCGEVWALCPFLCTLYRAVLGDMLVQSNKHGGTLVIYSRRLLLIFSYFYFSIALHCI